MPVKRRARRLRAFAISPACWSSALSEGSGRRSHHFWRPAREGGVASRKYLYTSNLSFSACLAENPGALKLENPNSLRETRVELVIFLVPCPCPFPDPSPCPGRGQAARRLRLFCNRLYPRGGAPAT